MDKDGIYGMIISSFSFYMISIAINTYCDNYLMQNSLRSSHYGNGEKMYSTVQTAILDGIKTMPITVEVDISEGMPMFDMVGNLAPEVREARDRVRTALHNCGIILPPKRITLNLSPGNVRKTGTLFDLPIAVALLLSMGLVQEEYCKNRVFVGELSLMGQILPVAGVLPIVCDGVDSGLEEFIVPAKNQKEASLAQGATCYGFSHLGDLIAFLNGTPYREETGEEEKEKNRSLELDFAEVNGQTFLKRACEVAVSGMHNMLMIGPPGTGKTMVSERIPTIMPALTREEQLELSKIYSVCGLLTEDGHLIESRPFRSPHHTVTRTALTGGGTILKPGEISLSHEGVLFLDELTEFQKSTLEVLRQPLEEHEINLVRLNGRIRYPANFLLLAAMNPCNCGYYPDMQKCRCTPQSRKRYFQRISQPLIDRIDICVEAPPLTYGELTGRSVNEASSTIRARVERCQKIQLERYEKEPFHHNSEIPASKMKIYCALGEKQQKYMENIYESMALTGRTYHKILRVARTLADMDGEEMIRLEHLSEAICYRSINEKYWGREE